MAMINVLFWLLSIHIIFNWHQVLFMVENYKFYSHKCVIYSSSIIYATNTHHSIVWKDYSDWRECWNLWQFEMDLSWAIFEGYMDVVLALDRDHFRQKKIRLKIIYAKRSVKYLCLRKCDECWLIAYPRKTKLQPKWDPK